MDSLTGSVERITYYNPENGYTVLRLRPDRGRVSGINRDGMATVTGNLPELSPGEYLQLEGQWVNHPRHGMQFQVEICTQTVPATVAGIRRYLGSGLIKGIGPKLADRIVARFGKNTLDFIENQPEKLRDVPDIGPKRAAMIAAAWDEQKQVKEIMLFLHSHGISTNLAIKIYKQYGDQSLAVLQEDPYRLAQDIYGVGFMTADKIAQDLGLPHDHPARIEAGLVYALNQATDDGHVYLPATDLTGKSLKLLEVDEKLVLPAVDRLLKEKRVIREYLPITDYETAGEELAKGGAPVENLATQEPSGVYGLQAIYLTPLYHSEKGLAERVKGLMQAFPTRMSSLPASFINLETNLSQEQQSAIRMAITHPVSILTGGPGTGKTTALRALIQVLAQAGKRYALASPTGRAAKRLSQATGKDASTIHRLLGFSPREGFKYNAENPLLLDFLVIDEASMLDQSLAYHLLRALEPGIHLLLVGDVDQLPSVGAGDVLRDLIASQQAPVTRLTEIFRQAAHSQIITNAHRVNQGQMPKFESASQANQNKPQGDFFLFPADTPEDAARWVQDVVCNRIPVKFGFHPSRDIQVLSPMYRGPVGVTALNALLQGSLNPPDLLKPEKKLFGQVFRVGDKLMQTQNNYDKEVFNGDIGFLFAINPVEQTLIIDFEGRTVEFDWTEADQLSLAYAISVHKAQGSEFPAVVIPLVSQHFMMLQRNLLYTAMTRAKQLCVLIGNRRAIGIAVRNNQVAHRHTALDWRISNSRDQAF